MNLYGIWRCITELQDQVRQVLPLKNVRATLIGGDKEQARVIFIQDRRELSKCLQEKNSGEVLLI